MPCRCSGTHAILPGCSSCLGSYTAGLESQQATASCWSAGMHLMTFRNLLICLDLCCKHRAASSQSSQAASVTCPEQQLMALQYSIGQDWQPPCSSRCTHCPHCCFCKGTWQSFSADLTSQAKHAWLWTACLTMPAGVQASGASPDRCCSAEATGLARCRS